VTPPASPLTTPLGSSDSAQQPLAAAWACCDAGRLDDAVRLARQALEQSPEGRASACAALGWFLLSAGSVGDAEALLTASLGLYPEHAPLHWYLGLVYLREQRLEEASQALLAAVTFNPNLDEAAVSLAWVLGDLHKFDQATHYARHALAIQVQPDRLAQLGWFLLSQEQWEEATQPLTQALALEPQRADARAHLSTALQRLGRHEEALTLLSDGLEITPQAVELRHLHMRLLLELHRTDAAHTACHQLLRLQPQEGMGWFLLSQVLVQRKQLGIATRALLRARRLAPALPELWLQTGWLALEMNDLRTVRDAVERLLKLAPEAVASDILAAVVMEKSGNLQAASEHAEQAVPQRAIRRCMACTGPGARPPGPPG